MKENIVLGVDIGATWLRVALAERGGSLLQKKREPIQADSPLQVSEQIGRLGEGLCRAIGVKKEQLSGIGVASAGPVDRKKGKLINPTNIPLEEVPLVGPLEERFKTRVLLINDGISAVLAESEYGAGRGYENIVYITISTGIGGGVLGDGNLLMGKDGNAAEIGHFTIDEKGELQCGCGLRGHWEAYCSGSNIPNFVKTKVEKGDYKEASSELPYLVREKFDDFQAQDLFRLARDGDKIAVQLVEKIGRLNAIGFAAVTDAYDPELITVGGGVALNNPKLVLDPIREQISNHSQNRVPEILPTPLEDENVLLGAVARALDCHS